MHNESLCFCINHSSTNLFCFVRKNFHSIIQPKTTWREILNRQMGKVSRKDAKTSGVYSLPLGEVKVFFARFYYSLVILLDAGSTPKWNSKVSLQTCSVLCYYVCPPIISTAAAACTSVWKSLLRKKNCSYIVWCFMYS